MKIMLGTAGLLTEAAIAACGSSGPSPAYQEGYDHGTSNHAGREGAKEDTATARQNGEAMCSLLVAKVGANAGYDQTDWIKGCTDAYVKGKSLNARMDSDTP